MGNKRAPYNWSIQLHSFLSGDQELHRKILGFDGNKADNNIPAKQFRVRKDRSAPASSGQIPLRADPGGPDSFEEGRDEFEVICEYSFSMKSDVKKWWGWTKSIMIIWPSSFWRILHSWCARLRRYRPLWSSNRPIRRSTFLPGWSSRGATRRLR